MKTSLHELMQTLWDRFGKNKWMAGEGRQAPEFYAAAFGKHPQWKDFFGVGIEENGRLADIRGILYDQGINANIESGVWGDAAKEMETLSSRFGHDFVWCNHSDTVAGKIVPSRDQLGRLRPLVGCIHCRNLSHGAALGLAYGELEGLVQRFAHAASQERARASLEEACAAVAAKASTDPANKSRARDPKAALAWLAARPELGPDHRGLVRVLYHLCGHAETHFSDPRKTVSLSSSALPQQIRVPWGSDDLQEGAVHWLDFVTAYFRSADEFVLISPFAGSWFDVIVGRPGARELTCLLQPLEDLPYTTDIPYDIGADFSRQAEKALAHAAERDAGHEHGPPPADTTDPSHT